MHRTTEALRKMGATSVRLEVRKSNVAAQRFYEKLGFKYVYTIEDYYENDDALVFFTTL